MSTPTTLSGFTAIPITYSASATYYIYAREHGAGSSKKKDVWPAGRTLFMVNVPPDATEREVTLFLKHAGTVERVCFDVDTGNDAPFVDEKDGSDIEDVQDEQEEEDEDMEEESNARRKRRKVVKDPTPKVTVLPMPHRKLRPSGRSAHVIFLDTSSLTRALASSSSKPRAWPVDGPTGLSHYLDAYNALRPSLSVVSDHANSYMELFEYEAAQAKQKSKYKKGEAIVDEDGFTLVTRGGAYGQTLGGGVSVATKAFQETGETSLNPARKRKEKKEKQNFYAFQKAENQRNRESSY